MTHSSHARRPDHVKRESSHMGRTALPPSGNMGVGTRGCARRNAETNTAMAKAVGHKVTRESKFRGSRTLAWRGSHGLAGD